MALQFTGKVKDNISTGQKQEAFPGLSYIYIFIVSLPYANYLREIIIYQSHNELSSLYTDVLKLVSLSWLLWSQHFGHYMLQTFFYDVCSSH